MKIFLGGTCGKSTWRDGLIPILKSLHIDFYNPVITGRDRTDQDRLDEIEARQTSDYVLYVITPDMRGVYSIAEVVDDSNRRPSKTLFLYLPETDTNKYPVDGMYRSLSEVGELVERNRASWFKTWDGLVGWLKSQSERRTIHA